MQDCDYDMPWGKSRKVIIVLLPPFYVIKTYSK